MNSRSRSLSPRKKINTTKTSPISNIYERGDKQLSSVSSITKNILESSILVGKIINEPILISEKEASTEHTQEWFFIFTFLFVFLSALIFSSADLLLFVKVNQLVLFLSLPNFQIYNIRSQFILIDLERLIDYFFIQFDGLCNMTDISLTPHSHESNEEIFSLIWYAWIFPNYFQ